MKMPKFIKDQLSKVIEWEDFQPEVLWQRWNDGNDEIINASKIIIQPGQGAALVYDGKLQAILVDNGLYNLKTDNHPFITNISRLRQSFESEHKLFIYFFQTRQISNEDWGTSQTIKYIDPVYDFPVELGCNGTFSYRIGDPEYFYTQIVGSQDSFTVEEVQTLFNGRIPTSISTYLSEKRYPYNEIDAQKMVISEELIPVIQLEMKTLGLDITDFKLLGTYFDDETRENIKKIASIQSDKFAAESAGMNYEKLEKLRALRDAAKNEGGLAGAGVGIGAGMELGKNLSSSFSEDSNNIDNEQEKVLKLIEDLKELKDNNVLSEDEFQNKKTELLKRL